MAVKIVVVVEAVAVVVVVVVIGCCRCCCCCCCCCCWWWWCCCRYEMVYRQAVSSEDMFLQLGNKTPMTSSCEELVVSHCLQKLCFPFSATVQGILFRTRLSCLKPVDINKPRNYGSNLFFFFLLNWTQISLCVFVLFKSSFYCERKSWPYSTETA